MRDVVYSLESDGLASAMDEERVSRRGEDRVAARCGQCSAWLRESNCCIPYLCDLCKKKMREAQEAEYETRVDAWRALAAADPHHPPPYPKPLPVQPPVRSLVRRKRERSQ